MKWSGILIPEGTAKEDIKAREKIIKDYYAEWLSKNPERKIWNDNIKDFIYVKYLSINETYNKAARRYDSTVAIFDLTSILQKAILIKEKLAKKNDKNQRAFDKLLIMKYGKVKLIVGNQVSLNQKVQYSISVPGENNLKKKAADRQL